MYNAGRELLHYILLYIMVVMGASLTLLFNGPTSRNVAGYKSGDWCDLQSFTLGIVAVSPLSILGVPHHLAGAQQVPSLAIYLYPD